MRIFFKKKGSARFISHLDLVRVMTRALRLAHLPVWYTEGFNPRVYLAFAMPLSLGMAGERECVDIRLTEEISLPEVAQRLSERLPGDIPIISAAKPVHRLEEVAYAQYELCLYDMRRERVIEDLEKLFSGEKIIVSKHTKKGKREIDIKPYFSSLSLITKEERDVLIRVSLPASNSGGINPRLLLDALGYEDIFEETTRVRLLLSDFSDFE